MCGSLTTCQLASGTGFGGGVLWARLMTVKNGYVARVWKDLYDAEGVAVRVVPPLTATHSLETPRELWVPDSKTHVAVEIMRKV